MKIKVYEKGGLYVPVTSVDSEYFMMVEAIRWCEKEKRSVCSDSFAKIKIKNIDEVVERILKKENPAISIEELLKNNGFSVVYESGEKKKKGRPKKA